MEEGMKAQNVQTKIVKVLSILNFTVLKCLGLLANVQ